MELHVGPFSRLPPKQREILAARRHARRLVGLVMRGPHLRILKLNVDLIGCCEGSKENSHLHLRLHLRLARRPHRQLTAQELPAPRPPAGWPANKCQLCLETFPDKQKWNKQVKQICTPVTVTDHKCPHCQLPFWTAHAKGRHSVVCKQRRLAEGLALSSSG